MEIILSLFASASAASSVPTGTSGVGWSVLACVFAVVIVSLVALLMLQRRIYRSLQERVVELTTHALKLEAQIAAEAAPEFCLRDIVQTWHRPAEDDDGERLVLVKFTTVAGMVDFHWWVKNQSKRAKDAARAKK